MNWRLFGFLSFASVIAILVAYALGIKGNLSATTLPTCVGIFCFAVADILDAIRKGGA